MDAKNYPDNAKDSEAQAYPEAPTPKPCNFPSVRVETALYIHANMEADRRKWSLSTLIREAVAGWLADNAE